MKRTILAGVLILTSGLTALWAQKPKSQEELKAVQALQAAAADPDAVIKAAEDLTTKFADTDYKEFALIMEARAYQQKNDNVNAQVYAERVLTINPKSYLMELVVGEAVTKSMKDFDLDRSDKETKATKMFNDAIANVKAATKPNPQMADADWAQQEKYIEAEAHNGLGMIAQANAGLYKKPEEKDKAQAQWEIGVKEFQAAYEGDPEQDAYATRLANADLAAGKTKDALDLCNKLLAKPNLHPAIKQVLDSIKKNAEAVSK